MLPQELQNPDLQNISAIAFEDEDNIVAGLLERSEVFRSKKDEIFRRAEVYVQNIRKNKEVLSIEAFLQEYKLSTYDGVAILCLAEALLRIPDSRTADELIQDKLEKGDWQKHVKEDGDFLMNSGAYGLLLSSEIFLAEKSKNRLTKSIGKVVSSISEPIIRGALKKGMEILGSKFVIGTNIEKAVSKANKINEKEGYKFSFDMLGEAARTYEQAREYKESYLKGILHSAEFMKDRDDTDFLYHRPNISIKLSALHPRYELRKLELLKEELLPDVIELVEFARENNIWISIDAEESYRLELSLILFEEVLKQPQFKGYDGIGFVLQAYGKKSFAVVKHLKMLGEKYGKKIPVRLVKGAYWDYEIKHAQENSLKNYPVFTRKSHTDLSYLVCAYEMVKNADVFYPQFASHSAVTLASLIEVLPDDEDGRLYEFQRLYGMGETLFRDLVGEIQCRIYAPVGNYEDLLPYLIRRILENGANNSFVSMAIDDDEPMGEILKDPIDKIIERSYTGKNIILPRDIYQPDRFNSRGYELGNLIHFEKINGFIENDDTQYLMPKSIVSGKEIVVSDSVSVSGAILASKNYQKEWLGFGVERRAEILVGLSDLIEKNEGEVLNILVHEANKTADDAINEVREAVDFLRYYACEAVKLMDNSSPEILKGYTGEVSHLEYRPKGVFACISPWNFPLAIFLGQIAANLACGNCVIAKPAEQTEKIAYYIVKLAHEAGLPKDALQLILGDGAEVGQYITGSKDIAGVCFTGSNPTANHIAKDLQNRKGAPIAKFIAETGGQNCMVVDSSALLEVACDDAIKSAFYSAGQRCSALRVLYIQDEVADKFIEMLKGATACLQVGAPSDISNDIPPVIDSQAHKGLNDHIEDFRAKAQFITETSNEIEDGDHCYIKPTIFEIDSISDLEKENFGPILHVIRFKRGKIDDVIEEINNSGFGLTFGIQSRIDDFVNYVIARVNAGNIYINRNITGAIVETHPFGGFGLSGTGPKAGHKDYLKALVNEVTIINNISAIGGNLELVVG